MTVRSESSCELLYYITHYIMWHNFSPSAMKVNSLLLITQNTPVNLGAVH